MMEYQGYVGRVEYDADRDTFHGVSVGTRDVITFEGRSVEELHQAFRDSVDTYLEVCKEAGKSPDPPFSGQVVVRIDPELHRTIATRAALAGMSLDAWFVEILRSVASPNLERDKVEQPNVGKTGRAKRPAQKRRRKPEGA